MTLEESVKLFIRNLDIDYDEVMAFGQAIADMHGVPLDYRHAFEAVFYLMNGGPRAVLAKNRVHLKKAEAGLAPWPKLNVQICTEQLERDVAACHAYEALHPREPVVRFDDMGRAASAEDRANYTALMEVGQ